MFIEECREKGAGNPQKSLQTVPASNIDHAFDQLEIEYKEALALTYLKQLTPDEAAGILQVSPVELKSRLMKGIQSISEKMGYDKYFDGCEEYREKFIDYLGRTLEREDKVELEMHLHSCGGCQRELASFQEIILILKDDTDTSGIPSEFMEKVKSRVEEAEKRRMLKKRKRSRFGLTAAGIVTFLICTGFVTNSFSHLYYSWVGWKHHEDEQMITYLKAGLGEQLDMEQVNNGVKVKIKTAVADDVQTLIYYEIEDLNGENQYLINPNEGIRVENEFDVLNRENYNMYYPSFEKSDLETEEKNVYKGKMTLPPIKEDEATIELEVMNLQKVVDDAKRSEPMYYEQLEFVKGEWSFKIPVTKEPSIVHDLAVEKEVGGVPIRFDKLTIAPTATVLEYSYENGPSDKRINHIGLDSLETQEGEAEALLYGGGGFIGSSSNRISLETSFETLYFEDPEELKVHFGPYQLFFEKKKVIDIDMSKEFPQTFDYLGKNLTIEYVKPGDPTKIEIRNDIKENKEFDRIELNVLTEDQRGLTMGGAGEGVLVDKSGKIYDLEDRSVSYEDLEQPRYIQTSYIFEMANEYSDEQVIPLSLEIYGYSTTQYTDETVDISLN